MKTTKSILVKLFSKFYTAKANTPKPKLNSELNLTILDPEEIKRNRCKQYDYAA